MDGNVSAYCQCLSVIPGNGKNFHKGQMFLTMLLEVLHILQIQCKQETFQFAKVKNYPTLNF